MPRQKMEGMKSEKQMKTNEFRIKKRRSDRRKRVGVRNVMFKRRE